jgi:ketosteroid isomerase-like protein
LEFGFVKLLVVLLLSLPRVALSVTESEDPVEAVRCAEIRFSQSVENQDLEAFADSVDPDARFVSSTVLRGREAVVESWSKAFFGSGVEILWRPSVVEVLQSGELALSRGPYRMSRKAEDGSVQESWGRFNSTWRLNADGRWRVVFDAGGDVGMTPTEEERALLETDLCHQAKPGP